MKRIIFLSSLMFLSIVAVAQQTKPTINFTKTTHDFKDVLEEKGPVSYSFEFANTGGQPLVIHNVSASCGCTSPEWTKTPIAPGAKGTVKAIFDPANRPGPFNKTITVYSNSTESSIILRIVGNVVEKPKTVEVEYPVVMGNMRLKSNYISFTRIAPGTSKTEKLEVINTSSEPVKVAFANVPAYVTVSMTPSSLPAGAKGVITATYDAQKKNDWGFVSDVVYLNINDKVDYNTQRLNLSATIEEDFSKLSKVELEKAAKATFSEKNFDFGVVSDAEVQKHSFTVTNSGQSDLIIRKVKASCGCTAVQPTKTLLKPNESTTIIASFNPKGFTGRQSKSITVITNDPIATNVVLSITAEVQPKK